MKTIDQILEPYFTDGKGVVYSKRLDEAKQAILSDIEEIKPKPKAIKHIGNQEPREYMTGKREITVNKNHQAIGYNEGVEDFMKSIKAYMGKGEL